MGRRLENLEQFGIDVVLERRHGVRASILRGILYALSFAYDRLVQLRVFFYFKKNFFARAPVDFAGNPLRALVRLRSARTAAALFLSQKNFSRARAWRSRDQRGQPDCWRHGQDTDCGKDRPRAPNRRAGSE